METKAGGCRMVCQDGGSGPGVAPPAVSGKKKPRKTKGGHSCGTPPVGSLLGKFKIVFPSPSDKENLNSDTA